MPLDQDARPEAAPFSMNSEGGFPPVAEPSPMPVPEDGASAESSLEAGTVAKPAGKEHHDFLTAIILAVICVGAIIASYGYYQASGNIFYESPGLMPTLVASGTLVCAIILFIGSIKGSSVAARARQLADSVPVTLRSGRFWNSIAALMIFGIYIFLLLRVFPFWLASFIMLCFTFFYTNASSVIKIILISALSVAGIVLLFQVAFNVPLP